MDVRGGEFFSELMGALDALQQSTLELKILFLDCDDDALIKRFKETRRKHPLDGDADGLPAAIERERELLVPLRERADKVINTSRSRRANCARSCSALSSRPRTLRA